jgi:hypothetical protein
LVNVGAEYLKRNLNMTSGHPQCVMLYMT